MDDPCSIENMEYWLSLCKKTFTLDGQTREAKLSSQLVKLPQCPAFRDFKMKKKMGKFLAEGHD